MTVFSVAGDAPASEGVGRDGLQRPTEMLGGGGIIERVQSSGPTLLPLAA